MSEVPWVNIGLVRRASRERRAIDRSLPSRRHERIEWISALTWTAVATAMAPLPAAADEGPDTSGLQSSRGKAEHEDPLPPLPVQELRARAPSPQWSTGFLLGACGVGTDGFWQATDFCGALLTEAIFLRQRQADVGIGPYAQVGTSGFVDVRGSLGASLHLPLGEVFHVASRVGPLLLYDGAASGGIEGFLELGVRGFNRDGHYAMTHSVVVGVQRALGTTARYGTTAWIGLRFDGFWLALPFALLAR